MPRSQRKQMPAKHVEPIEIAPRARAQTYEYDDIEMSKLFDLKLKDISIDPPTPPSIKASKVPLIPFDDNEIDKLVDSDLDLDMDEFDEF